MGWKDLYPRQQMGLIVMLFMIPLALLTTFVPFYIILGIGIGMLSGNTRRKRYQWPTGRFRRS